MLWNSFKIWSRTFLCSFYYLNILCPLFHQGVFLGSWKKENLSPYLPKAPEYARSMYTCTHVHAHMCTHTYICDTVLMTSQSLGTLAIFKHILHILVTELMISHFISFRTHGWIPSGPGDLLHRVPRVAPYLSPRRPKTLSRPFSALL